MEVEEIEALEGALAGLENEGCADSRPTVVPGRILQSGRVIRIKQSESLQS